jgi:hypothetical protein
MFHGQDFLFKWTTYLIRSQLPLVELNLTLKPSDFTLLFDNLATQAIIIFKTTKPRIFGYTIKKN